MRKSVRLLQAVACAVVLATCGYPRLAELDSGSGDAQSSGPPPPSCIGLATTCGANDNDNCCNSPEVRGGSYDRSYDLANDGNSGDKSYPATVSDFRLDKYEVTVERFRAFVDAGMGTQLSGLLAGAGAHTKIAGSGWNVNWNTSLAADKAALMAAVKCDPTYQTWTDTPAANEHRPMNCVTWYEAMAFCTWDGGYLATEAEWNYAATGGDQQRAYPWSSPAGLLTPLDGTHASYYDGTDCVGDAMAGCMVTDLVAVGTKPLGHGRWGQLDLAGNVWEWTLDWNTGYANPCADCAGLEATSSRVFRGGSYNNVAPLLRAGYRNAGGPTFRSSDIGFRCAKPL
jgi:formylglycine-generating enzyme required for sulfatase activity